MHSDHTKKGTSSRKKLGEILVAAKLLTEERLQEMLEKQKLQSLRLGEFLISTHVLTEKQMVRAVSEQQKIPIYSPDKFSVDIKLKDVVPEEVARSHRLIPLELSGELLYVAMRDPTDLIALDMVQQLTRTYVEPVICLEKDFRVLAKKVYGTSLDFNEQAFLSNIEEVSADQEGEAEVDTAEDTMNVDVLQSIAEDAPVVRLVNSILAQAVQQKASDIHISRSKARVYLQLRIDGVLVDILAPPQSVYLSLVSRIKLLSGMDISISRIPQDGRFSFRIQGHEVGVRASTLPTIHGEKVVLRLLDSRGGARRLSSLGLSERELRIVQNAIAKSYGMLLATGPTGSGKTTLLYSLLAKLNKPGVNIVTLEDPVEYQMERVAQVQLNRKAGMTFSQGLRAILRQDPNIIMVGEIRDSETADISIKASMTGHLVLSTLHTNDAAGAVTRFADMGIEPFLISSTLLVAIAQRLVRRLCPNCKERYKAPPEALRMLGLKNETAHLFRSKGCSECNNTGYNGRIGIYEVLEITDLVREKIIARDSSAEIKKSAVQAGELRTLAMNAASKVLEGETTFEEYISLSAMS